MAANGGGRGGGDVVFCVSPDQKVLSVHALDALVYRGPAILTAERIKDELFKKLPLLGKELHEFLENVGNRSLADPLYSNPFFMRYYIWDGHLNLVDLTDEKLGSNPSELVCPNGEPKLRQAVIRLEQNKVVRFIYDSEVLTALRTKPTDHSFLLIHEWLRNYYSDSATLREINAYLHSGAFIDQNPAAVRAFFEKFPSKMTNQQFQRFLIGPEEFRASFQAATDFMFKYRGESHTLYEQLADLEKSIAETSGETRARALETIRDRLKQFETLGSELNVGARPPADAGRGDYVLRIMRHYELTAKDLRQRFDELEQKVSGRSHARALKRETYDWQPRITESVDLVLCSTGSQQKLLSSDFALASSNIGATQALMQDCPGCSPEVWQARIARRLSVLSSSLRKPALLLSGRAKSLEQLKELYSRRQATSLPHEELDVTVHPPASCLAGGQLQATSSLDPSFRLEQLDALQASFVLTHHWLLQFLKSSASIRDLNFYLHSKRFFNDPPTKVRTELIRLGLTNADYEDRHIEFYRERN